MENGEGSLFAFIRTIQRAVVCGHSMDPRRGGVWMQQRVRTSAVLSSPGFAPSLPPNDGTVQWKVVTAAYAILLNRYVLIRVIRRNVDAEVRGCVFRERHCMLK